MARSTAKASFGVTLATSTTLGGTYTAFAEITSVQIPSQTVDVVEVTHHASPTKNSMGVKEKLGVLIDGGEIAGGLASR